VYLSFLVIGYSVDLPYVPGLDTEFYPVEVDEFLFLLASLSNEHRSYLREVLHVVCGNSLPRGNTAYTAASRT
jgi:hypothetical protein